MMATRRLHNVPMRLVCGIGKNQLNYYQGQARFSDTVSIDLLHPSPYRSASRERHISTESLPRIIRPSFWASLVPKFSRAKQETGMGESESKKKDWNPATFFIIMIMLIGSQAIQMIALRQDFVHFSNQSEAKLAKLRDVVRRIQNGEKVDVAAALGAGDQAVEREWEQVIRELEQEDEFYRTKRKKSKANASQAAGGGSDENASSWTKS